MPEIERVFSEARSIIEALADTLSHHLRYTHQVEDTNGLTIGMNWLNFQWSLRVYGTSYSGLPVQHDPLLRLRSADFDAKRTASRWNSYKRAASSSPDQTSTR